ncbi:hypothetical protein CPB84DRAFT_1851353 [Gymnopilus junonius]|uniref:Uncharacterized protein n=1 Tax=Gymnopilus junonius TaxID=109634 RepID=A0A9P5TJE3_GYMJU|nr:hypothetical protein CPB84DRAFT_1851353 [Gymnopilus junonius]
MAAYVPPYPPYPPYPQRSYSSAPNWAPGPPPYPGAPPIPPGVSVNPQAWNAGVWQYNPAYKRSAQQQQQQHVPWIPSHHWIPQQPQSNPSQQPAQPPQPSHHASFNPYKRQPREPSAEYLATELSDNPLGLFNMTPATVEEYYKRGHETPWIWKPRDLDQDPSDPSPDSNPEKNESFTAKIELQPTFSSKIVRTPEHYRNGSDPTSSPNRTPSRSSKSSMDSQLSSRISQMSIGSSSSANTNPLTRHSSLPLTASSSFSSLYSSSPTKPDFGPAPVLTDHFSDEPDSILSPLVLSNTPLPAPSKGLRSVRNNHPNPLLATQSLDTIPEAPASRFAGTGSGTPQQLPVSGNGTAHHSPPPHHHANSLPNPPKSQLSYPPQMPSFPPPQPLPSKSRDREKERDKERESQRERERERDRDKLGTRHTTYVDPHYSSSTSSPRNANPSSSSRPSPSSGPSSNHASPLRSSSNNTTPPAVAYPTSPPSANLMSSPPHGPLPNPIRSSPPTRSDTTSTLSNPLPPPPRLVQRPPILPVQRTPPPHYREKLRKGFWNRRGDHLTADGYIVYAPSEKAFPDELRTYPPSDEGYQDHNRIFAAWTERPELPQSLPRRGEPPECPYDAFVVYEYKV